MSSPDTARSRAADLSPADRSRLGRRAQLLAGASVVYNGIEAVVAIAAGLVAGSVALVGFGLESIVEVSSGLIILWQFRHRLPESREQQALRLMALSFFALAAYVTFESVRARSATTTPIPRRSASRWLRRRWSSCPSCPGPSGAPAGLSAPTRWSRTPRRRCCAQTFRPCCSSGWSSTPPSVGPGPTPSPASSLLRSR